MTQAELAGPYTAAFVSRVEVGDAIPSLGSLKLMTERLSMSLSQFFVLVESIDAGQSEGSASSRDGRARGESRLATSRRVGRNPE
jgi:hypothetical protein